LSYLKHTREAYFATYFIFVCENYHGKENIELFRIHCASSIFTFLYNLGKTVSDVSTWKSKRSNALFIII